MLVTLAHLHVMGVGIYIKKTLKLVGKIYHTLHAHAIEHTYSI